MVSAWVWRLPGKSSLAHGGEIRAASEPGEGAQFTVVLPVEGAKEEQS
jgi:signal transduction histidine kinase